MIYTTPRDHSDVCATRYFSPSCQTYNTAAPNYFQSDTMRNKGPEWSIPSLWHTPTAAPTGKPCPRVHYVFMYYPSEQLSAIICIRWTGTKSNVPAKRNKDLLHENSFMFVSTSSQQIFQIRNIYVTCNIIMNINYSITLSFLILSNDIYQYQPMSMKPKKFEVIHSVLASFKASEEFNLSQPKPIKNK